MCVCVLTVEPYQFTFLGSQNRVLCEHDEEFVSWLVF